MIYFDNSATSLIKPDNVKFEVMNAVNNLTANPGRSGHSKSMQVAEKIFEVREKVKDFFNAKDYEVVFTKNCTEALNLAIFGFLNSGDHVITTCYEHNSVLRPLERLKQNGVEVTILDCDLGEVSYYIEKEIKSNTKLVITTAVSNVTGESCDIISIGQICKKRGVKYLVDGAQSSGHKKIDLEMCNADMYAFAGHKGLLALTGIGGLIVKNGINLKPLLCGGTGSMSESLTQPKDIPEGLEAGTVSTISIISLGAGIDYLNKNLEKIKNEEEKLSIYMYNSLKSLNFLKFYSKNNSENVFCFNVNNLDSSFVADKLNEKEICVRSGLHCAPLIHKKLGTLDFGAVRVSLDFHNTKQQINFLVETLKEIASL
ncbi:MAG: aminotransferase class V-fold PLP-dependent enzyme [Clostridiales bacterium]|nr:aminotransferase class V-fold PLP-dependent enzyme [Clostridiales bacterium]